VDVDDEYLLERELALYQLRTGQIELDAKSVARFPINERLVHYQMYHTDNVTPLKRYNSI
jgi:hypothetical protein